MNAPHEARTLATEGSAGAQATAEGDMQRAQPVACPRASPCARKRPAPQAESSCRAITSRCTSLVPSPIVQILTSR